MQNPQNIVSIHQPAYLPWLGYFNKIALSDTFVVLDTVQFEKNSFINRNKINSPNGPIWLSVPVLTKGKFGNNLIKDLKINNNEHWQKKHWKSISLNYSNAPFFKDYNLFFEEVYSKRWEDINTLCMEVTSYLCKELGIKTKILLASELEGLTGAKAELILNICKKLGAKTYISGVFGREYLNSQLFKDSSINLIYQSYRHPPYRQLNKAFVPNLSIIDLLFNYGKESFNIMMEKNHVEDFK